MLSCEEYFIILDAVAEFRATAVNDGRHGTVNRMDEALAEISKVSYHPSIPTRESYELLYSVMGKSDYKTIKRMIKKAKYNKQR